MNNNLIIKNASQLVTCSGFKAKQGEEMSNLNIIERLWRILKKKVVYNKFYQKFDDFRIAVINFFENEIWRDKEFENILTDNFQIIEPNFSGSYLC